MVPGAGHGPRNGYAAFGILGHSAFALAFSVPNLFRRLLGEAIAAFIPIFTQ
jgi:peptidoglycan biosynthesis protein MviN/MurJ (putative lipid II flippase)